MSNNSAKKKTIVAPYFTTKFPPLLRKNFKKEYTYIWEDLQKELLEVCKPGSPDYDKFMIMAPKLEVFTSIYSPSEEQKEMLVTVLLRLLFEEKTTNMNKILIMKQIDCIMGKKVFKHLRLNWRVVYKFLDETIFNPEHTLQYASGFNDKLVEKLAKYIRKFRVLYPEEAIGEVMTFVRSNVQPFFSCVSKGMCFLVLFFHTSSKFSRQYYVRWIPELFEFWSWKNSAIWDKAFLSIFAKLAREHPEIDWSPYYKQFFTTFLKLVKNEFPKKSASHVENVLEIATKFLSFYPKDNLTVYITELLVKMMRPKTFDYSQEYWENVERIIRATVPFLHPENQGKWSRSLAQFYNNFCKFYIKRHFREQEVLKSMKELQLKEAKAKARASEGLDGTDLHELTTSHVTELDQKISGAVKAASRTLDDLDKAINHVDADKDDKLAEFDDDVEKVNELESLIELEGEDEAKGGAEGNEDEQIEETDSEGEEEEEELEDKDSAQGDKQHQDGKLLKEKIDRSVYFLDETCHERFVEIMSFVVKNLLYSRDDEVTGFASKICRRLLLFKADVFAPLILNMMYSSFEQSDLSYFGFIKVFTLIAYPLFSRTNYRPGIYELPKILDVTLNHLTSHDHRKTIILLEFYEAIFELVPINHPDDLRKNYETHFGKKDDKAIKDALNEGEDVDLWELTEDLSDWSVRFFRKFIEILPLLEKSEDQRSTKVRSLVLIYRKFHSFFCQSSPRLLDKYTDILCNYLEENVQKFPSKYLTEIIHPLNLAAPELMAKKMIPLMKKKLLYKLSKPKTEEYSKKPLYNLIEKSSVAKIFDEYDLSITNKDALLWALNIVEDLVTYSSPAILDHTEDLELIIFHALLHDEHVVYEQAVEVLHILMLSLLSIYPTNTGSQDPADFTKEEFLNFYRKVGRPVKKDIEIIWHQPNQREIEYTMKMFNLLFETNLAWITNKYLRDFETPKDLTYEKLASLVDDMHLKAVETVRIERLELGRSLFLVYNIFLGISQRVPYGQIAKLDSMKLRFEENFCFKEFAHVREEICNFVGRFILFACPSSYINDPIISKTLIELLATAFGEDEHNIYMLNIKKFLKKYRKAFEVSDSKELYDNRYLLCMHIDLELEKRILGYHFSLDFYEKMFDLPMLLWFFTYHPEDSVSELAYNLIDKFTIFLEPSNKKQVMSKLATFTERLIRERFNFLNDNAKDLEEKDTIKFGSNEIVKTNKETYIDLLTHGVTRNLEYLYAFFSLNMDLLYPIIESMMNNPKVDDSFSLTAFYRILKCIDLSPHQLPNQNSKKKDDKKELPITILNSNKLYKKHETKLDATQYQPRNYYNVSHSFAETQKQMERSIAELGQEDVHWKHQLVAATLGMVVCRYFDPMSELFLKFVNIVFKQIFSDHFYLRLFAISAFPILMKKIPRKEASLNPVVKSPEDFEGLKLTIDEALKYKFLLKSDYEKYYIKDPYTGYFDIYQKLEVTNLHRELAIEMPKEMKEQVLNKEFFDKLFATMVTDVPTKDDVGGTSKTAFNFKNVIKHFFGKESKLKHNLPGSSDFSMTTASFLGSLFKYFGGAVVFNKSFDSIKEIAQDYDSRPKQVVAAHYFYATMKNFMHFDKEVQDDVLTKAAQLLLDAIDNVSFDNFLTWMFSFINGIFRTDYRLLKPFLDKILNDPFEKKTSNIQARYLTLHGIVVKYNGRLGEEVAQKSLNILLSFKPTDIRQATEMCQNLLIVLKYYIMAPLNYRKLKNEQIVEDIEKIVQENPDKYHVENDALLYCFNTKFIEITDRLIQEVKEETNLNQKKNYFEVFFNMLTVFYSERLSYFLFRQFENIITFFIELNTDETSLSPETIQLHSSYLAFLSKLAYPEKAIPKVLSIIKNCLASSNFRVRENALKFYHYFHFNHIYYLKDKSANMVVDSVLDENPAVRNMAFEVMVDFYKLFTKAELLKEIDTVKQLVKESSKAKDKVNELSKGLYILMTILLSHPYEIEEWTEELLVILLQTKKPKAVNEKFNKDFVVRFRDHHKGIVNVNQRTLSYEVHSDLREISNPSSYFV